MRPPAGVAVVRERGHFGVAPQLAMGMAQAAQKALVQGVDIDVACAIVHKAIHDAGIEHRHNGAQGIAVQALGIGRVLHGLGVSGVNQGLVRSRAHIHHAARMQDGRVHKPCRRVLIKRPAGACQRLHLLGAVMLFKQGGRTPGGVIAGLAFALQQQHALSGLRQLPAHRSTGHARTHHHHIPCRISHLASFGSIQCETLHPPAGLACGGTRAEGANGCLMWVKPWAQLARHWRIRGFQNKAQSPYWKTLHSVT